MKKGIVIALFLFFAAIPLVGVEKATADVIRGELISITGELYTVKTESEQGFRGSRESFHVDPKTTTKSGDLKIGTIVEAEVDRNNGHADWVKPYVKPMEDAK